MALILNLFILTLQTDFISSTECTTKNCDPSFCNGNSCTQCLPGYYKQFSEYCRKCSLRCRRCKGGHCFSCNPPTCVNDTDICNYGNCDTEGCSAYSFIKCSGCPDGFYLENTFCYRCDNINCKCSSASGCDECLPGYYDTTTFCTKCAPGKYGQSCELNCVRTCNDGTCNKKSGTCLTQCASAEYLDATRQCQSCPSPRCASCANSTYCDTCKQSFHWGTTCAYDCVACFYNCDRLTGCSKGCEESEYYNNYSPRKKGYECIRCFDQCKTCLNDTYCTSCKGNFWGRKCLYSCNNCAGTCDKDHGCTNNCELGYYRQQTETGHECKQCLPKCEQCLDSTTCKACEEGYYADGVSLKCIDCSINCTDNVCDNSNGTCRSGCLLGSTGQRCNEQCPTNCIECDQFNSSNCAFCKNDFYGASCESVCNQNCKSRNGTHECLKYDGSCKNGCEDGFWSKTCSEACPEQCVGTVCNYTTGKCSQGCKAGFHGSNCSLPCPTNCCGNKCFQDNGTCVEYILESTTSQNVEDSDDTQKGLAKLDSKNSANIGLAVVVGIVCIVAVASIILNVFLWKSRKASRPTAHRSHVDGRELTDRSPARQSENVGYEDLASVRPEEKMYSSITHEYENTNMSA